MNQIIDKTCNMLTEASSGWRDTEVLIAHSNLPVLVAEKILGHPFMGITPPRDLVGRNCINLYDCLVSSA